MSIISEIERSYMKKDVTEFGVGDTIRVQLKITEAGKDRLQSFEGIVIKRQGPAARESITVRKMVDAIGVERTFPLHSPRVESIKVVRKGKVRRAKLYYMRKLVGSKATKVDEG